METSEKRKMKQPKSSISSTEFSTQGRELHELPILVSSVFLKLFHMTLASQNLEHTNSI